MDIISSGAPGNGLSERETNEDEHKKKRERPLKKNLQRDLIVSKCSRKLVPIFSALLQIREDFSTTQECARARVYEVYQRKLIIATFSYL